MSFHNKLPHALTMGVALSLTLFGTTARGAIVIAENLLVELDAAGPGAGAGSWTNTGSLGGSFTEVGDVEPTFLGPNGNDALQFDDSDAYRGPAAPASITGAGTRSIEVWAFNPSIGDHETMVAWGRRGGPEGSNLAFTYGTNGTWGAVGHWGSPDMSWNGAPAAGGWHHLVYTYDGTAASVYADGVLKSTEAFASITHAGIPINVGAQNDGAGAIDPGNRYSGGIGRVRIHDGVLNAAAIANNFAMESPEYGIVPPPPPPPPVGLVSLWRFDDRNDLGKDSMPRNNHVTPQGDAAYSSGGRYFGAASLDGDGDMLDRAVFPTEVPTGNESYTVAAWFKSDQSSLPGDADPKGIIGWGNYGAVREVNALRLFMDNGFRHYWWGADLDASDAQVAAHGVNVDDGSWHHIAAVYDQLTGQRSLYLNGNLLVTDLPGANSAMPLNFAIGRTCTFCAGGEFWDGMLDDVAIFDRALSPAEIAVAMTGDFTALGGPGPAIPEPSSFLLAAVAIGLSGVAFNRRRERRKA